MKEGKWWPQDARCAALLTVNLDADQFWLGMFPDSATRPKTLSMGEYGIKRGLDRVLRTFDEYKIRTTFFIPGKVAENYPEAVEKILRYDHELAVHGYTHTGMHLLTAAQQGEEMEKAKAALQKISGVAPTGFRAPEGELTLETLKLAVQCGFAYSSSLYEDDRPYTISLDNGSLTEIPIHWELHDFPYFAFNYGPAFPSGQGRPAGYYQVTRTYQREFDAYYQYGLAYVAQFTPQTIGSPGKIKILEDVLQHITERNDVWIGTCGDLARFTTECFARG
jgi:peptidoglycan/xylan/chitin deacetylase (PgdA/CDA1 family)